MDLDAVLSILDKRPGMISVNHSLSEAALFIEGFLFAKSCANILTDREVRFKEDFSHWVMQVYECNIQSSWSQTILFYEGEEVRALKKFVILYNDFFGVE